MLHHVTKLLRSANNLRSCGPVLIHGSRNTGQRPPPHPSLMALALQGYTRCLECFGIKTLLFEVAWNWGCESKQLRPRQHSGDFYSLHCLQQERVALFTRLSKVAKLAKHPNSSSIAKWRNKSLLLFTECCHNMVWQGANKDLQDYEIRGSFRIYAFALVLTSHSALVAKELGKRRFCPLCSLACDCMQSWAGLAAFESIMNLEAVADSWIGTIKSLMSLRLSDSQSKTTKLS